MIELRTYLIKPELKYGDFVRERYRLQRNKELWARLVRGVKQAEIFITNRSDYLCLAYFRYLDQGAEPGVDFSRGDVGREAAKIVLEHSPLSAIPLLAYDFLSDNSHSHSYKRFDTVEMLERAGGKLNDAVVLATRSHAALDAIIQQVSDETGYGAGLGCYFGGHIMAAPSGVFDIEHAKSLTVLNDVGGALRRSLWLPVRRLPSARLFLEMDTRGVDHLQAADLAAGWACEMLDDGATYEKLADFFFSVKVNGRWIS